jgi:ribosome-binding protein aMBF1 (putative translation factor)
MGWLPRFKTGWTATQRFTLLSRLGAIARWPIFEMQQKRKTRLRRGPGMSKGNLAARKRDRKQESRIRKRLGDRIRRWRKSRGWSQEAFADDCRIHRSYIGAIERGEANLSVLTTIIVSRHLGVTASALFKGIA